MKSNEVPACMVMRLRAAINNEVHNGRDANCNWPIQYSRSNLRTFLSLCFQHASIDSCVSYFCAPQELRIPHPSIHSPAFRIHFLYIHTYIYIYIEYYWTIHLISPSFIKFLYSFQHRVCVTHHGCVPLGSNLFISSASAKHGTLGEINTVQFF